MYRQSSSCTSFPVLDLFSRPKFPDTIPAKYRLIQKKNATEAVEVERRGRYRWKALTFIKLHAKFHSPRSNTDKVIERERRWCQTHLISGRKEKRNSYNIWITSWGRNAWKVLIKNIILHQRTYKVSNIYFWYKEGGVTKRRFLRTLFANFCPEEVASDGFGGHALAALIFDFPR